MKKKILVFSQFYLPSYKAGGPVVSISNVISSLSNDFDFMVFTSDRDSKETNKFSDLTANEWTVFNQTNVYYADRKKINALLLIKLIKNSAPDSVYLNSFFSFKFSILPLFVLKILFPSIKLILAPRGEFSDGALSQRSRRKKIYILLFKFLNLKKNIIWHATNVDESQDVTRNLSINDDEIFISKNLIIKTDTELSSGLDISNPNLQITFLARVTPTKNLDLAIAVLNKVKRNVSFDIYGLIDNEPYWEKCKILISKLPKNINVKYCGILKTEEVIGVFKKYDILFLPTFGENFGHSIVESLFAGTRVLISDQTPWNDINDSNAGWAVSLEDKDRFVHIIDNIIDISPIQREQSRLHAKEFYEKAIDNQSAIEVLKNNLC